LKNSGTVVSSAATTFNSSVNIAGLTTIDNLNTKKQADTLVPALWSSSQTYSFNDGMVYTLASNDTPMTSLSINDIPDTPLKSYNFTFMIQPITVDSPYYLKPPTDVIIINGKISPFYGLENVSLPATYTYLIQEIKIINTSNTSTPSFSAFTNVSGFGYTEQLQQTLLIAGGGTNNTVSLSRDNGVSWVQSQYLNGEGYRCAFNGKIIVMGLTNNIMYSNDFGINWTLTGFTLMSIVYNIIYIEETSKWFAVGSNSSSKRTIASSVDGINWTLLDTTIFNRRCYNIVYNGSVYIAVGWGTYPLAKSSDGINWDYITTLPQVPGYHIFNDGNQYIASSEANRNSTGGNIWTSQDGVTWDTSKNIDLQFDVRCIAYNGIDTYVASGSKNGFLSGTIFYYWSNDLINWYPPNNYLLGTINWWIDWNGKYFTICGDSNNGVSIIYSLDGKNWTASDNQPFTNKCYGTSSITY
jgi:hypothetical protein